MILIPKKVGFRIREILRSKGDIMIKEVIHQEVVTILNVYEPKKIGLKFRELIPTGQDSWTVSPISSLSAVPIQSLTSNVQMYLILSVGVPGGLARQGQGWEGVI